jgi:hypothetical protein
MTFRRSGWRLLPWYFYLALCWAFASLFAVCFFIAASFHDPWNVERVLTVAMIGFLVFPTTRAALRAHAWIRRFRRHYLMLDDRGVRFRLPDTDELTLAWNDIESVTSDKPWLTYNSIWAFGYRTKVFTIVSRAGRYSFTNMEIPRPGRAAEEILRRIGRVQ